MAGIHSYMSKHHEHCDDIFARAREAATAGDLAAAERDCKSFVREIERHIDAEENILFPAFEERSGMAGGPTRVMRMEHAQMRDLFAELLVALEKKDSARYAEAAERLADILGEHNMKEENILYPMLEKMLGGDGETVLTRVKAIMD